MIKNLSIPVSSAQVARNTFSRLLAPVTYGFFKDNYWNGPGQVFRAIRALGGEVEIESSNYFDIPNTNGIGPDGKRWILQVTCNGFTFPAVLTASFGASKPGESDIYDLTLTT